VARRLAGRGADAGRGRDARPAGAAALVVLAAVDTGRFGLPRGEAASDIAASSSS
jgi:hypothetical protein